ncbi:type II secretion system protein GspJ [Stutzerimonas nitrititolerans]|uniref:type II secretion system protein GspJ n=1 Tax=Stutzerimonas nitrititolerans TaxID=2482751 RepID=UPI0028A06E3A|nr:type II secretion system protein GspJ [Stutzerimonas nitrititolerans]
MNASHARCTTRKAAGFTLIEVMVAIMLMAIVSMIAWRGLDGIARARTHLEDSTEHTAQLMRALNQLKRDLDMRATTELMAPVDDQENPPVEDRSLPVAVKVQGGGPGSPKLALIRNSADRKGTLQRVRWWVEGDTLYRASAQPRERYPLPAPRDAVAVLEGLTKFSIRIWQPSKGWSTVSSAELNNPAGLEVRLSRRGSQGDENYRLVMNLDD